MRLGVTVSLIGRGRATSLDELTQQIGTMAASGFDSAWLAQISTLDALTALTVVGLSVPDIELGTAVLPVYTRHPVAMAQQALTTQAAIGGRLALGLGLSHQVVVEQSWGIAFERPANFMREYLEVLQPLLRGESVDFAGQQLKVRTQLTVPDGQPPSVLLAALGPRMLRLAGESSDGTITWMAGPRTIEEHVAPTLRAAASAAGRPAPRIVVSLPICVTDDVAGARARAARNFERYGQLPSYRAMLDREGAAGPADVIVVGPEADVERQLARLEAAGGTEFVASVFGSGAEQDRTWQFLRSAVAHGRRTPV